MSSSLYADNSKISISHLASHLNSSHISYCLLSIFIWLFNGFLKFKSFRIECLCPPYKSSLLHLSQQKLHSIFRLKFQNSSSLSNTPCITPISSTFEIHQGHLPLALIKVTIPSCLHYSHHLPGLPLSPYSLF